MHSQASGRPSQRLNPAPDVSVSLLPQNSANHPEREDSETPNVLRNTKARMLLVPSFVGVGGMGGAILSSHPDAYLASVMCGMRRRQAYIELQITIPCWRDLHWSS